MKDNYMGKKRVAPSWFSEVRAYYVVMMSHAIDRYLSLSSAHPGLHDCRTFTRVHTFMKKTQNTCIN